MAAAAAHTVGVYLWLLHIQSLAVVVTVLVCCLHILIRWAGQVARMGERRGVFRVLVDKPGGRRPLGRPRRRWEDNIKMDLQEVGCVGAWTGLSWLRIGTGGGRL